jgi:hypothetical protein
VRYLGSKRRIAKQIADVVNAARHDRVLLEPFCGGLGATFAFGGQVLASDVNQSLIALYETVQSAGVEWLPTRVTAGERAGALDRADSDPLKAFMRIGCGYGGDWNGGHARNDARNDYVQQTINALRKINAAADGVGFCCIDFFSIPVTPGEILYLDPPYRGGAGYAHSFDFDAFERRAYDWADAGSDVFVSEYDFPIGDCVWSAELAQMNGKLRRATERLFRVTP